MKIYNNNSAFGDGGPFDFDGSDFDAACGAFADEMEDCFYTLASEAWEADDNIDPGTDEDEWLVARVEEMRAEFIAGLTEVK